MAILGLKNWKINMKICKNWRKLFLQSGCNGLIYFCTCHGHSGDTGGTIGGLGSLKGGGVLGELGAEADNRIMKKCEEIHSRLAFIKVQNPPSEKIKSSSLTFAGFKNSPM